MDGLGTAPLGTAPLGSGTTSAPSVPYFEPPRHEWAAFARNLAFDADLDLPILSADIVIRHMDVGRALLSTPYTAERWAALGPGRGLLLYRDGVLVFTGVVDDPLEFVLEPGTGRTLINVSASSDEALLADRIVFPDPLRAADDQTVNNYWKFTGAASTAMLRLISDQAGPTCRADRRIPGLTLGADPHLGQVRTWSTLFTRDGNLLQRLGRMSMVSGVDLGVRVTAADGQVAAAVYEPRDLSQSVKFAAGLGNLAGFTYRQSPPTVTHALVAGQGDLAARVRRLAVTTDPLALEWRRQRWTYIDRRDTDDVSDLDKEAQDAVADGGPKIDLAVTLTDSQAATYGTDWILGDRVRIYVGAPGDAPVAEVADVVREIRFQVFESGAEQITPAVGTADASALPKPPSQKKLREVGVRLSSLIANK